MSDGFNSEWTVLTLAIIIAVIHALTGSWSEKVFLALVLIVLLGAIFPAAALFFLALAGLQLLLTRGQSLFTGNLTAGFTTITQVFTQKPPQG